MGRVFSASSAALLFLTFIVLLSLKAPIAYANEADVKHHKEDDSHGAPQAEVTSIWSGWLPEAVPRFDQARSSVSDWFSQRMSSLSDVVSRGTKMIQRRKEEVQSVQEAEPNLQGRSEGEEETQKRSKKENRDEHSGTEDLKHRLHEEAKAVYGTGEDLVRQGKQKLAKEVEL